MKSSLGFHPWYLFLGYMASSFSCVSAVISNWNSLWSLTIHDWIPYIQSISEFILIIFQWLLFLLFYIVFIIYYKEEVPIIPARDKKSTPELGLGDEDFFSEEDPVVDVPDIYKDSNKINCTQRSKNIFAMRTKKSNATLFFISQLIGLLSLIITVMMLYDQIEYVLTWSYILGISTLIMFSLHYAPQIWETFRLKRVGSLSLVTLSIMCPGTFVWTYFLANGSNASPSIWIPYLTVGIMQAVLLAIGIRYEIRDRHRISL